MARLLLDTDAIIDYLKGFDSTVSLITDRHRAGDTLCVSDVLIAEVYTGPRPHDRPQAARLVRACTFLPTSAEIAQQAGEWRYRHARQGLTIATTDALIAATAHAHRARVVTGNTAHYPMPELSLLPLARRGSSS